MPRLLLPKLSARSARPAPAAVIRKSASIPDVETYVSGMGKRRGFPTVRFSKVSGVEPPDGFTPMVDAGGEPLTVYRSQSVMDSVGTLAVNNPVPDTVNGFRFNKGSLGAGLYFSGRPVELVNALAENGNIGPSAGIGAYQIEAKKPLIGNIDSTSITDMRRQLATGEYDLGVLLGEDGVVLEAILPASRIEKGPVARTFATHVALPVQNTWVGDKPLFFAEHMSSPAAVAKMLAGSRNLENPSVAVRLLGAPGQHTESGISFLVPKQSITPGGALRVNYGTGDIVSSIREDFLGLVRSGFKKLTGRELTKEEFRARNSAEVKKAIDLAYDELYRLDQRSDPSSPITTRDPKVADALRHTQLIEFTEKYSPQMYHEAKVNDDIPLVDTVALVDRDTTGVGALASFRNRQKLAEMRGDRFPIPYERLRKERMMQNEMIKELERIGVKTIPYGTREKLNYHDAIKASGMTFEDAKGGNTRSDAKGGDTPGAPGAPVPEGSAPAQPGGPRIVLNPQVFRDKRDALCVTFNEGMRVVMEENGFEPVSEPTEKQRKFFADTAYADDELQLRRTILARIATLDTSVSDPTDEQLEETVEMLEMVMEVGAPQNEWEQQAVQRLHDVVAKAREGHVQPEEAPPEAPQDEASTQADVGGGVTGDDEDERTRGAKAAETFDTPIPEELKAKYDAWYAQLPKNLQYTGDYDLQGAWLEKLGQPDKYEAAQNGHLDDYGKKPNHITFSSGSKWHDPKVPERTGGEWRQAKDGSWDFYPGTGNKASDDELKAYFDKYEKGNRVHRREVRQDAPGGQAGKSVVNFTDDAWRKLHGLA